MITLHDLLTRISTLLERSALVSFHDAHRMIRVAKALGEPRNAIVLGFVALHDDNATDGARALFAEYLRVAGARLEAQEKLASRALLLKDDGKIARCRPGSTLAFELEEKRAAGLRWQLVEVQGPAMVERAANRDEAAPRARFSLHCAKPGLVRVRFEEREPGGSMYSHAQSRRPTYQTRKMALTVIVEA